MASADEPRTTVASQSAHPAAPVVTRTYDVDALTSAKGYASSLFQQARAQAERARARQVAAKRLPTRLGNQRAFDILHDAGLGWHSSGGCTNWRVPTCTSLQDVRSHTVNEAIALRQRSHCPMTITGGTETGHAPGPYSHRAGYKLDIEPTRCMDSYIKRTYPFRHMRGDGAPLYWSNKDPGTVYAREPDHWDILFR
jgi:hypothetical protein